MSLFFNEKSDVLLLTTNRIMIDLDNPNQYVVALALTSFCEISDVYMCETLFTRILDKTNSPQKYIKKKALLACRPATLTARHESVEEGARQSR